MIKIFYDDEDATIEFDAERTTQPIKIPQEKELVCWCPRCDRAIMSF